MAKMEILKCHCGAVELESTLPNGTKNLRKCTVQFVTEKTQ